MSTISENLQTIADSLSNIRQSIINKGGNIEGDITTYATAIADLSTVGGGDMPTNLVASSEPNADNAKIYEYLSQLSLNDDRFMESDSGSNLSIVIRNNGISLYSHAGMEYTFTASGIIILPTGGMP